MISLDVLSSPLLHSPPTPSVSVSLSFCLCRYLFQSVCVSVAPLSQSLSQSVVSVGLSQSVSFAPCSSLSVTALLLHLFHTLFISDALFRTAICCLSLCRRRSQSQSVPVCLFRCLSQPVSSAVCPSLSLSLSVPVSLSLCCCRSVSVYFCSPSGGPRRQKFRSPPSPLLRTQS